ncbi:hypothetical protein F5Y04DRAFT_264172 [Hypomontagnella monticulosa]|nr:hypothetical protein F5Y04DRAFT_264172 [Hypomontagnella monticulosa]
MLALDIEKSPRPLRSQSVTNMLHAMPDASGMATRPIRDITLEKVNLNNLRDWAESFRISDPRSTTRLSSQKSRDMLAPGKNRTLSVESLKKDRRARTQAQSIASYSSSTTPGNTATSISHGPRSPRPRHQFSRLRSQSSSSIPTQQGDQRWPERTSSRKGWPHPLATVASPNSSSQDICPELKMGPSFEKGANNCSSSGTVIEPIGEISESNVSSHGQHIQSAKPLAAESKANVSKVSAESGSGGIRDERGVLESVVLKYPLTPQIEDQRVKPAQPDSAFLGASPSPKLRLPVNTKRPCYPSLVVPQYSTLPESPGFPGMLAAISFPSPPTAVNPPSRDRSNNSITYCGATVTTTPSAVQPRKRTSTSDGELTTSFDEALTRPVSPDRQHVVSRCISYNSLTQEQRVQVSPTPMVSMAITMARDVLISSDVSSLPSSRTSFTPLRTAYDSPALSERESLASDITEMTSLNQVSPTVNKQFNAAVTAVATDSNSLASGVVSDPKSTMYHNFTYPLPTSNPDQSQPCGEEDSGSIYRTPRDERQSPKTESDGKISTLMGRDGGGRKSIIERRIARRINVKAYKRRHPDACQFGLEPLAIGPALEIKDSPVLGWFAGNDPYTRDMSQQQSTKPNTTQLSPITNIPAACGNAVPLSSGNAKTSAPLRTSPGAVKEKNDTTPMNLVSRNSWTLSPVMVSQIVPEQETDIPTPPSTIDEVTISPLMVIMNEQPPNLPASPLSVMHIATTTHLPPRPQTRHKIRLMPQSRQKSTSIVFHRNPTTGDIERVEPTIGKLNRHSLTTIQSLPSSPNAISLRRRSHPAGDLSLARPVSFSNPISQWEEPTPQDTGDQDERCGSETRALSSRERLKREKMAREDEISQLVERTVGAPRFWEVSEEGDVDNSGADHTTQQIERQLRRLEEDGDIWIRNVKTLLESMSRTLVELREDNEALTVYDFFV